MRFSYSLAAMLLAAIATLAPAAGADSQDERIAVAELAERWGIESRGIRLSANGYMLDFRFRLLDAEKAAPLFAGQGNVVLEHPASGAQLLVPTPGKVGPLHTLGSTPRPGKVHFVIFANPGRLVKAGEAVEVAIGKLRLHGLKVEG